MKALSRMPTWGITLVLGCVIVALLHASESGVSAQKSKSIVRTTDETAIRKIIQDEVNAWNLGDAAAYSGQVATDGTFTNIVKPQTSWSCTNN